jgi:H+-translocating NAD(P) transhydrogenase subunit alpha
VTGELIVSVYVCVLAGFLGFELISKVPPTLHTPLMSGANAMSGVTIVGALSLVAVADAGLGTWFGVAALALATVNVVGGFLVTDRMLGTFSRGAAGGQGETAARAERS